MGVLPASDYNVVSPSLPRTQLSGGPTNVVLLENLMPAKNMINPVERREVRG